MLEAGTGLRLEMKDGKVFEGEIWLDSCVNVLGIALYGEGAGELEVKALGWDLDSPRLAIGAPNGKPCQSAASQHNPYRKNFCGKFMDKKCI